MKELKDIIDAYQSVALTGRPAALATLVKVEGSAYRRPGARMLITDQGSWVGALSGGCLEADICDRAQHVIQTGAPALAIYDTTHEDDVIWGLGLGCQGVAHVLIEPIRHTAECNPISLLRSCLKSRKSGGVAIIFEATGDDPSIAELGTEALGTEALGIEALGTVLLHHPDGTLRYGLGWSQLKSGALKSQIQSDLQTAILNNKSTHKTYTAQKDGIGVSLDVSLQVIQPAVSLTIFGAGHDALPVAKLAKQLGWYVRVIDTKARRPSTERFGIADEVCLVTSATLPLSHATDNHSAAVIMTHNYYTDLDLLKFQLFEPWTYLGLLGPKSRRDRLLMELQGQGITVTPEQTKKLHSPIGLDIGAETPEEIALSILSEIQAVLTHKPGYSLKHKDTAIHTPSTLRPEYTLAV